jgi:hypothetical protein
MECPLCKYPKFPGVQVWVNDDTETNIVAIAKHLDKLVASTRSKNLKAFVVYANVNHDPDQPLHQAVSELAARNRLTNVALVVLPAWDKQAVA